MMKNRLLTLLLQSVTGLLVLFPMPSAHSQAPAAPTVIPIDSIAPLPDDKALQVLISVEAKRMPLLELLAALQKQSGVALKTAEDFPAARKLVTARLDAMPLSSVMKSLSQIFAVRWDKDGDSYVMHSGEADPIRLQVRRISAFGPMRGEQIERQEQQEQQQKSELADELFNSVDATLWRSPLGVALPDLAPELRERLLTVIRGDERSGYVRQYMSEAQAFDRKLELRLGKIALNTSVLYPGQADRLKMASWYYFERPQLAVYTVDGRFVTNIFPSFRSPIESLTPQLQAQTPGAR